MWRGLILQDSETTLKCLQRGGESHSHLSTRETKGGGNLVSVRWG